MKSLWLSLLGCSLCLGAYCTDLQMAITRCDEGAYNAAVAKIGDDKEALNEKVAGVPLVHLAMKCEQSLVMDLLKRGADPKARNGNGESAIFRAAEHQSFEFLVWLSLEHGFSLDSKDNKGGTVLYRALFAKNVRTVKGVLFLNEWHMGNVTMRSVKLEIVTLREEIKEWVRRVPPIVWKLKIARSKQEIAGALGVLCKKNKDKAERAYDTALKVAFQASRRPETDSKVELALQNLDEKDELWVAALKELHSRRKTTEKVVRELDELKSRQEKTAEHLDEFRRFLAHEFSR